MIMLIMIHLNVIIMEYVILIIVAVCKQVNYVPNYVGAQLYVIISILDVVANEFAQKNTVYVLCRVEHVMRTVLVVNVSVKMNVHVRISLNVPLEQSL